MPYTKTTWVNNSAPNIDATNLNKIETGIATAQTAAETAQTAATGAQTTANSANTAAAAAGDAATAAQTAANTRVKTVTSNLQIDAGPLTSRPPAGTANRIWIATS